jgi:hypothetical protein
MYSIDDDDDDDDDDDNCDGCATINVLSLIDTSISKLVIPLANRCVNDCNVPSCNDDDDDDDILALCDHINDDN